LDWLFPEGSNVWKQSAHKERLTLGVLPIFPMIGARGFPALPVDGSRSKVWKGSGLFFQALEK